MISKTPIEILRLPERTFNVLINHGIESIEDLQVMKVEELRGLRGMGECGIEAIQESMYNYILNNKTYANS